MVETTTGEHAAARSAAAGSHQQALAEALRALNSPARTAEVLNLIVDLAARALRVKGCSLMLLSPDRREFFHVAARGLSSRYLRKGPVLTERSVTEALAGAPVYVADASQDPRVQYREAAAKEGIVSVLSLPLLLKGETIGVLRAYAARSREFDAEELEFLRSLGDLAAVALERGRQERPSPEGETEFSQELLEWYAQHGLEQRRADDGFRFAHPSEEEFARLLDFYRVRWHYEPRAFVLDWEDGRAPENFSPDFYLPELDLYVELTTMRQRLATVKNRKLRRLRELYPEVNIILLNRRDYHRLLTKYGYRPISEPQTPGIGRILFNESQIQERVRALGDEIAKDYQGRQPVLVGVLKGVLPFMADLMRHVPIPLEVDYMAVSSYEGTESGAVRILKDLTRTVAGRDVLLVEDIVDTGMTLHRLLDHLASHGPASLEVCTLLDKRARRLVDAPLKYVGFPIGDEFVVGYGLDYREEYRNLPFIAALSTG